MDWNHRHPSVAHFGRFFETAHLANDHLRSVSGEFAAIADSMVQRLPDSPELSACLRKIVEAKDCAVRAAVAASPTPPGPNIPGH